MLEIGQECWTADLIEGNEEAIFTCFILEINPEPQTKTLRSVGVFDNIYKIDVPEAPNERNVNGIWWIQLEQVIWPKDNKPADKEWTKKLRKDLNVDVEFKVLK